MARQWANISLSGTRSGHPAIRFGGPLTEVTACRQSPSCTSISGGRAWAQLWTAVNANAQTRISGLPYSTDLRIN
jgi:hypothetical protein